MSANSTPSSASEIRRASEVALDDLVAAVNRVLADYIIPIQIDADYVKGHVDLAGSYVAVDGGTGAILAFSFMDSNFGTKSDRTRIGAFGAVPEARGTGLAKQLLKRVIDDARASGAPHIELECFAQNERAIRLYLGAGFQSLYDLRGYTRDAAPGEAVAGSSSDLSSFEVSSADAQKWLDAHLGDSKISWLPFQVGWVWREMPSGVARFFLARNPDGNDALMVCYGAKDESKEIRAQLIDTEADRQEGARALIRALIAAYPGKKIDVSPLQRPDLGGDALEAEGFKRQELHQQFMVLDLS